MCFLLFTKDFYTLETEKISCQSTIGPSTLGSTANSWISMVTQNPRSCALWTNIKPECSSKFFYSPLNGDCSCEKESDECKPYWNLNIVRKDINQYQVAKGKL